MTREEQIMEAARQHDYDSVVFGEIFAEGARWADAHPKEEESEKNDYLKELLGYDPVEEFEQMVAKVYKEGGRP